MEEQPGILFCNCTFAGVIPRTVKAEVLERLSASGVAFHAVADLCEMCACKHPFVKRLAGAGELRIAACFPRAVIWLFHIADAPFAREQVEVFNMREASAGQVAARLLSGHSTPGEPQQ